jgi:hypothetical protein
VLTEHDCREIHAALESFRQSPTTDGDEEWRSHLTDIMAKIGPDGCNLADAMDAWCPSLNDRELATALFALRMYQTHRDNWAGFMLNSGHFEECDALSNDEVDELCERLNLVDEPREPIYLGIVVQGGIIQSVCSNAPDRLSQIIKDIVVIDYDTDGSDDRLVDVPQGNGTTAPAVVDGWDICLSGIDLADVVRQAADEQGEPAR